MSLISENLKYCIFDPTGNITALVETAVDIAEQPAVAARIMELEPDVEQVGFISYAEDPAAGGAPVSLRMAGGEFCGNATMCAAALFAIRSGLQGGAVPVKVWGISAPFEVLLERQAALNYSAAVSIPPALDMDELRLADGMLPGSDSLNLPIVRMEGISHVIIEPDSGFFGLKDDPALAETLLKGWCGVLGAECLGMMFLGEGAALRTLVPLVYVPGADTMFWENSCASGSAAAGMYLAARAGSSVDITFEEPAGRLRVESDPASGLTVLHGSAILLGSTIFAIQ
jgi:diaminopimelate epimerase